MSQMSQMSQKSLPKITLYIPRTYKSLRVIIDIEGDARLVWLNPRNVVDLKRKSRKDGDSEFFRIYSYVLTVTDSAKGDGILTSFEVHEVVNDGHVVTRPGDTTDHLRRFLKEYAAVIDDFEWFSQIHAKGVVSCLWPNKDRSSKDLWTYLRSEIAQVASKASNAMA